jgi:protein-disulfide isomerase
MDTQHRETRTNYQLVPLAIVVAGLMIAGAIYFGGKSPQLAQGNLTGNQGPTQAATGVIEPVTASDHIIGSPDAKVVVVEYSDYECPFCKNFHNTMHQIVDAYKGDVAWVYREFPIAQLHSKAAKESEAAECVTELGGNTAFWHDSLDPAQLPIIAQAAGVDFQAFNACLSSGKYTKKIEQAVAAAGKAGALGTPYSVAISKSGKKVAINGAQPFEVVKATIDSLLK